METTTTVSPTPHHHGPEPRWSAVAVFDGRPTTWACTHLHHSPEQAEKCQPRLQREVEGWLASPALTSRDLGDGLREWSVKSKSKRFRFTGSAQ